MTRTLRVLAGEQGVALLAVILAIFILTASVILLAFSTMGESTQSFDQLRGQQALAVAEAGAYRALAELRRRVHVDLRTQTELVSSLDTTIRDICNQQNGRRQIELITRYAYPTSLGASDWALDGDTATLTTGMVTMTDPGSGAVGQFSVTMHVRPSGGVATCQFGTNVPEQEILWFDYAILAMGRVGNATKTVCLHSPFADRCPDWDWVPPYQGWTNWQGSFTITGSYRGIPVLITKASYSQWALMLLDVSNVWLYTGTVINGPVHSNTGIRIAGNPVLNDNVTQVSPDMTFRNCGSGNVNIAVPSSGDPNASLWVSGCDNDADLSGGGTARYPVFRGTVQGNASAISLPNNANPSRTSSGLANPDDPTNATQPEVYNNISAAYRAQLETELGGPLDPNNLPDGLFVMQPAVCASPPCGGVYIKGDVQQMVLSSESDQQVIRLEMQTAPAGRRFMRVEINPDTKALTVYWNCDSSATTCTSSASFGGNTFNGIFYIGGSITTATDAGGNPDPTVPSGLYGTMNRRMRLTIAAEQHINITDVLVYEAPPAGPGHNTANVLGLYAVNGDVNMVGPLTPDNLYIDAVVLTPRGRFQVTNIGVIPDKGNLYHLGGTVQGTFGAFGQFVPDLRGYGRVMTYDWRLRSNVSPPFFPLTDRYTAVRYPSQEAVFVNGDPLYDRPQWEEMVGL